MSPQKCSKRARGKVVRFSLIFVHSDFAKAMVERMKPRTAGGRAKVGLASWFLPPRGSGLFLGLFGSMLGIPRIVLGSVVGLASLVFVHIGQVHCFRSNEKHKSEEQGTLFQIQAWCLFGEAPMGHLFWPPSGVQRLSPCLACVRTLDLHVLLTCPVGGEDLIFRLNGLVGLWGMVVPSRFSVVEIYCVARGWRVVDGI